MGRMGVMQRRVAGRGAEQSSCWARLAVGMDFSMVTSSPWGDGRGRCRLCRAASRWARGAGRGQQRSAEQSRGSAGASRAWSWCSMRLKCGGW